MSALVGRERVLAQAVQSMMSCSGVLFVGAAGIGKSALGLALGQQLGAQGSHVEIVRCSAATTQVPFAPLLHLLPRATTSNPTQMSLSLIDSLKTRAANRPLVLVVDDLQHSDPGTATVMFSLLTQQSAKVIASTRPADTIAPAVQSLWKDGHLDRVDLARLDDHSIAAIAKELTTGELTPGLRTELTRKAAGNPFYATALTRSGLRSGAIQQEGDKWDLVSPLPESGEIADLLESQLRDLTPESRDLLTTISVAENMAPEVVADEDQRQLIPALIAERLVAVDRESPTHSLRCAHPLIAEHLRGQLSSTRLRQIELTIVDRVAQLENATPVALLRAATMAIRSDAAVDVAMLESAARVALSMTEYDLALQIALRASALRPSAETHLLAGTALSLIGEVDAAHHQFAAVTNATRRHDDLSARYEWSPSRSHRARCRVDSGRSVRRNRPSPRAHRAWYVCHEQVHDRLVRRARHGGRSRPGFVDHRYEQSALCWSDQYGRHWVAQVPVQSGQRHESASDLERSLSTRETKRRTRRCLVQSAHDHPAHDGCPR